MKVDKLLIFFLIAAFSVTFYSCRHEDNRTETGISKTAAQEYEITEIILTGEASLNKAELSGLTWFGDNLILLPQYPFKLGNNNVGRIFKISKTRILDFINGKNTAAIEPQSIRIIGKSLERFNKYGDGYESIAFNGNDVYLTIEAFENFKMAGYIVKGKINDEATEIVLDKNSLAQIKPQANIYNLTDETIFIYKNLIYTLYEANGKNINTNPLAHKFETDLKSFGTAKFPNIEYRITDATIPDNEGKFWAINYMYSGDWNDLNPADDNEDKSGGKYVELENSQIVERLLEFQIKDSAIIRTETAAVKFKLLNNNEGRNWEGVAKLENYGFLLTTDYFPRTILGYLQYKKE